MTQFSADLFSYLTLILAVFVVLLTIVWLWLQHNYDYWKRHNIPYLKPHLIFGNIKDIITLKENPAEHFQSLYRNKKADNEPVLGVFLFNKPALLLREPELIKAVMIKDFNKFSDRFTSADPHSDSIGADNLFFAKNPRWKEIRVKLTPVFTSGKIKQMFSLISEVGRELDKYLCALPVDPKTNSIEREVKEINALYSTDVIATVAYGIRANSLQNPNGDFRTNGKRIFDFTPMRAFEFNSMFFLPQISKLFKFKVFSKETSSFIRKTITYAIEEREKSGMKRNDLIDVLIAFKKSAEAESKVSGKKHFILERETLIAQAAIFFSAGFETSSSTMSFALFELSRHQDLQQRLREEIRENLEKNNGEVTYDMVNEMTYLNQVVREVLRLYPPLPFLDRECTLEKGEQNYSLKPYVDFSIPNRMPVVIPIYALQRDPKYFPNPETFDPDRFDVSIQGNQTPFVYLPFGTGPHNCIGDRFGLLQSKLGIINFLRNHYVTPCAKSHTTMKLDSRALIIQSDGGVFCNIVRDPLM